MAYGTGALNIDGCRVTMNSADRDHARTAVMGAWTESNTTTGGTSGRTGEAFAPAAGGRWPANVLLSHPPILVDGEPVGDACADGCVDGCPVAELDRQSAGTRAAKPSKTGSAGAHRDAIYGGGRGLPRDYVPISRDDDGGASRFFPTFRYQAKAPKGERPRLADGTSHPTVKPLALMRWLVRLITPPGGIVLDNFAGSGTTLEAARAEGMRALGVDDDPVSVALAVVRLTRPAGQRDLRAVPAPATEQPPPAKPVDGQLGLFGEVPA